MSNSCAEPTLKGTRVPTTDILRLGWAFALAEMSTLNDAETGPQSVEVLNKFAVLLNVTGLMLKVLLASISFGSRPVLVKPSPTTVPASVATDPAADST
jgi:hypothetical protein